MYNYLTGFINTDGSEKQHYYQKLFIVELQDVTLGQELAEGGEGVVYQAQWLTTDVAAKVVRGKYNNMILGECRKLQ